MEQFNNDDLEYVVDDYYDVPDFEYDVDDYYDVPDFEDDDIFLADNAPHGSSDFDSADDSDFEDDLETVRLLRDFALCFVLCCRLWNGMEKDERFDFVFCFLVWQSKAKTDTSASEARKGKDIQGIPWERLNYGRDKYREMRLKQYKNYENLSRSREDLDKVSELSQFHLPWFLTKNYEY